MTSPERQLEEQFIEKLRSLKYEYRPDVRDRASLEKNFREKFETLNRVRLTDTEFQRLLDELITPDVFTAARVLRELHTYTITHAIEDKNVLKFHVDYYRPERIDSKNAPGPGQFLAKRAVIKAIHRVLNATKPYGHILDFRARQDAVDVAIALFSGVKNDAKVREIWLVDPAPTVVEKLKTALGKLDDFMRSQDLEPVPENVPALRGDEARAAFIERFREVQRLKTQLDQYTDLPPDTRAEVEQLLPKDELNAYES
jgi:type I restriction enzyme R subunit